MEGPDLTTLLLLLFVLCCIMYRSLNSKKSFSKKDFFLQYDSINQTIYLLIGIIIVTVVIIKRLTDLYL
jgi:hypothetical protein